MAVATHYARSGDVHIAYQVFGSGPIDLIIAPGLVSVEACWDEPGFARWLEQFARNARVDHLRQAWYGPVGSGG